MAGRKSDFTLPTLDDLFSTQELRDDAKLSKIRDIPLELIDDFPDHPFKVRDDEDMIQLVESIKERGVITPATVRQKEDGRYELISGHRRKRACELAGFEALRCEVVDLDRDGLRTIQMVNSIWKDLSQFLGSRSETSFQPVYGLEYLHERIGYPECLYRKLTPNERDYIRAVRMLTSFQETGTIPEALTRNRDNWSEPVKEIRDVYIRYCEEVFKTHAIQRSRIAAADRFMRIVIVNKGVVWEDISAKIISEYAMSLAEYAKATAEVHLRGLRYFLHFLYETGNTKQDFSITVPKLCCGTGERIPHMLSTEQVNILLDSIDRGNPIGKRNYAIIMMATSLGMRDSDIVNLKFDNIDWEKSTISFRRKQTSF